MSEKFSSKIIWAVILVLIFGGLFAYVYFYEKKKPSKSREDLENEEEISFVNEDQNKVKKLILEKGGKKLVFAKRSSELWVFEEPIQEAAEKSKIEEIINELVDLKAIKKIEGDLKDFGLENPLAKAELELEDGKVIKILFGEKNPEESGYYTKIEEKEGIFLIRSYIFTKIFQEEDYFKKSIENQNQEK